jgi:hypothetical protein
MFENKKTSITFFSWQMAKVGKYSKIGGLLVCFKVHGSNKYRFYMRSHKKNEKTYFLYTGSGLPQVVVQTEHETIDSPCKVVSHSFMLLLCRIVFNAFFVW